MKRQYSDSMEICGAFCVWLILCQPACNHIKLFLKEIMLLRKKIVLLGQKCAAVMYSVKVFVECEMGLQ